MIEFKTLNSTYQLDQENETWARVATSKTSGKIRDENGDMWGHGPIVVGEPVKIFGPPKVEGSPMRIIITSLVVEGSGDAWYYQSEKFWDQVEAETSTYI